MTEDQNGRCWVIKGQIGLVLGRVTGGGAVNLVLEKNEKETIRGMVEVRLEVNLKVSGMVADAPTMDILGKMYGAFGEWGMVAGKAEVLLVVLIYIYFLFIHLLL